MQPVPHLHGQRRTHKCPERFEQGKCGEGEDIICHAVRLLNTRRMLVLSALQKADDSEQESPDHERGNRRAA